MLRKNRSNQLSSPTRRYIFDDILVCDETIEAQRAQQGQLLPTFGNAHEDDSVVYQSPDKLKSSPITESELLYDSAFRPIKRSTFNLTYSVSEIPSKGNNEVAVNRISHHNRVISQPINRVIQPIADPETLYCNGCQEGFVTLPPIRQSMVISTFDKIKNKRPEHLRSHSWSPVVSTKEREEGEDSFVSLVAEEVDNISEKGIRNHKFVASEIENGTPIFNKDDRVGETLELEANAKSETVVSSHINEFSKFFANDPEVNGSRRFYQTEIPIPSTSVVRSRLSEVQRERAELIDFEQESPEIPLTKRIRESPCCEADKTYPPQEPAKKNHEEKLNELRNKPFLPAELTQHQFVKNNYIPKIYKQTLQQGRSESISTTDNVSHMHTKNNSEEIHISARLRALEKVLTKETIPEYQMLEQQLVRGKFVESLLLPSEKPARLSNQYSQKELPSDRSQGIYKSFVTSPQSKVFQQQLPSPTQHGYQHQRSKAFVFP